MADRDCSMPLEDLIVVSIICETCREELKVNVSVLKEAITNFIAGQPTCPRRHIYPLKVYEALSHLQRYFHLLDDRDHEDQPHFEAIVHLQAWFHKLGGHPVRFWMQEACA